MRDSRDTIVGIGEESGRRTTRLVLNVFYLFNPRTTNFPPCCRLTVAATDVPIIDSPSHCRHRRCTARVGGVPLRQQRHPRGRRRHGSLTTLPPERSDRKIQLDPELTPTGAPRLSVIWDQARHTDPEFRLPVEILDEIFPMTHFQTLPDLLSSLTRSKSLALRNLRYSRRSLSYSRSLETACRSASRALLVARERNSSRRLDHTARSRGAI